MSRPNRTNLAGLSLSELKTLLKLRGHKVDRNLYKSGYVTRYSGRAYRFRYWAEEGFVVDISCPLSEFDRWANSVEKTITFDEWRRTHE
jgi:hypothetical protein